MSTADTIAEGIEVLRLLARGWTPTQVATQLRISDTTVSRRLRKLYGVLGAAHAVAIAGVQRLLAPEDLRAALEDRRTGWKPEGGDQ